MKPFRKPFLGDPLFPFHIHHQHVKHPEDELPDHLHEHYELVYIHQGAGRFFIDNSVYEKKSGDLFIIPGNTVHRSLPDELNPIISTAVFFAPAFASADLYDDSYSPLQCFDSARRQKHYKFELPPIEHSVIEAALALMNEEQNKRPDGYRTSIRLELGKLLLYLNRYLALHFASGKADKRIGPSWIKRALHDIDAQPWLPHSLADFAGDASVSPSHFSRVFKQFTGMNVTDYVNAKRIIQAKSMLLESDESIAGIAEACGFSSIPHFHRIFKSLTGSTPAAYRREESDS
ncbi:AraC family transcriptional regulator [Paenibacillus pasadenensis]|uniref:helix-turn-helix transcriptional regulator n=1 Tax=Paenibacillus pasadenensis TaxID=217090 RepID=UPI00203A63BE|nr:AraC family transcriptional regulator [Paenibacillus pasadenensis]MCM3748710.1 AraC family transcriptional regulator [Paenibacillus pasadenensis]